MGATDTQADFALNALNTPDPIGNFSTRISGGWQIFDTLKTERQIHGADLMQKRHRVRARKQ
jgi:hypothetical protein